MPEETDQYACHDHPQGGQQAGFPDDGPDRLPACAETAVEHDEQQGDGTDVLGKDLIVEIDRPETRAGEDDTQHHEYQQGWDTDPQGQVVEPDANQNDGGNDDQEERGHAAKIAIFLRRLSSIRVSGMASERTASATASKAAQ